MAPDSTGSTQHNRIVVGVDGSAASDRAVSWAIAEAARCETELLIVSAWETPDVGPEGFEFAPPGSSVEAMAAKQARQRAASALDQAHRTLATERVHTLVAAGNAAEMLIEQSEHADLLVVGSRGRGGFRGLLLGSVSQQCASHAHCPVVVVRSEHIVGTGSAAGAGAR